MEMRKPTIIIMGSTGVGKSDFAEKLARAIGGEIINCDVGQFYTLLSIGTAKPDWKKSDIPHHMFDILDTPENYSVTAYRAHAEKLIQETKGRGKYPLIVGGSGFYVNALFFDPITQTDTDIVVPEPVKEINWEALFAIDPERAQKIHPHDTYRIERALQLWQTTGVLPSQQKPILKPVSDNFILIHVNRDRSELYERINARTLAMITGLEAGCEAESFSLDDGWIGEVRRLPKAWHEFLLKKGLIGYPEIIEYLRTHSTTTQPASLATLIRSIQKGTRNYAKRQMTYWRMISAKLRDCKEGQILEANLTLSPVDLYIRQLQKTLL